MQKDVYEIEVSQGGVTKHYPAYTCGHCSNVIVMRPNRVRERKRCLSCARLICEMSDICASHCTPLFALAQDHFESSGEFGKYVPAIMSGVMSKEEAHQKGLINP